MNLSKKEVEQMFTNNPTDIEDDEIFAKYMYYFYKIKNINEGENVGLFGKVNSLLLYIINKDDIYLFKEYMLLLESEKYVINDNSILECDDEDMIVQTIPNLIDSTNVIQAYHFSILKGKKQMIKFFETKFLNVNSSWCVYDEHTCFMQEDIRTFIEILIDKNCKSNLYGYSLKRLSSLLDHFPVYIIPDFRSKYDTLTVDNWMSFKEELNNTWDKHTKVQEEMDKGEINESITIREKELVKISSQIDELLKIKQRIEKEIEDLKSTQEDDSSTVD